MSKKIRWGVLSTANIGLKKVIPGMQRCEHAEIVAIASRSLEPAQQAAARLGIAKAYGSYDELLADPEIDAIYNPLPNDQHVPWSIKAAEAGKHVLCEKPIALSSEETRALIAARDRTGVKIGEAFMVQSHPQWKRASELIAEGRIGQLRLVQGAFSYFNVKPENIRNHPEKGGGALMDIGCYLIFLSRLLFRESPTRVLALIDRDPEMQIDRLTSFLLDFPSGQATGTCSTQLVPYQRIQAFGTKGRIEVVIPVNTPPNRPIHIVIDDGGDLFGAGLSTESFPAVGDGGIDQYTLQGDDFSRAILNDTQVPVPLEEALVTMRIMEALFRSAGTNAWETP